MSKEPQRKEADYQPNYKIKCMVCGQKPTINIVPAGGSSMIKTEMCGPCTWGEAETIDPATW